MNLLRTIAALGFLSLPGCVTNEEKTENDVKETEGNRAVIDGDGYQLHNGDEVIIFASNNAPYRYKLDLIDKDNECNEPEVRLINEKDQYTCRNPKYIFTFEENPKKN